MKSVIATTQEGMESCANPTESLKVAAHGIRGAVSMLGTIRQDLWSCPDESVETYNIALQRLLAIADTCSSASTQGAES